MEDFPFMPLLFGFLISIWLVRLAFSKRKKEVLKEGPIQMTYSDGRSTRDLSGKEVITFILLVGFGISVLVWIASH